MRHEKAGEGTCSWCVQGEGSVEVCCVVLCCVLVTIEQKPGYLRLCLLFSFFSFPIDRTYEVSMETPGQR